MFFSFAFLVSCGSSYIVLVKRESKYGTMLYVQYLWCGMGWDGMVWYNIVPTKRARSRRAKVHIGAGGLVVRALELEPRVRVR